MHGLSALFGALLGFLAAIVPSLLQMLRDRFSHKREMESREQELEAVKSGYEYTIHNLNDLTTTQAKQITDLQTQLQTQALDAADDSDIKGHPVMLFLRSSVRPIITYGFFTLFAVIRLWSLANGLHNHETVTQLLPVVWDEDAESLFAAVITFWFGSRFMGESKRDLAQPHTPKPVTTLKGTNTVIGE